MLNIYPPKNILQIMIQSFEKQDLGQDEEDEEDK